MQNADVIVVGAGAAGLATAIFVARRRPGARVVALDGAKRLGAKILVSGGGRCNVTNVRVTPEDFYGGNRNVLRRVLRAFTETDAANFFAELGVGLHIEGYGKLFPDSGRALDVVAALVGEAERLGVQLLTRERVTSVARDGEEFEVIARGEDEETRWRASRVVLATGGLSLPKTGSDGYGYELAKRLGHSIVPTTPALDPLVLNGGPHAELAGIAQDVVLTAHVAGERPVRIAGPMLWTHFGVSGPAALNVSRFWQRARVEGREVRITVNFTGLPDFAAADRSLVEAARQQPRLRAATAVHRWVPARVAEALCRLAECQPDLELGRMGRETRRRLAHTLVEWPLPITGTRGYRFAEVTAGGVPLAELDPATMASRACPGLYCVGEIVDVDGRIGGFNFQWAWSSAYVAAAAIARETSDDRE